MDTLPAILPGTVFRREFAIGPSQIDEKGRTVRLSFSSEIPVEQWFGREILDHSPSSVDLARMANGAPLLVDHNRSDQVGIVVKAWLDRGRGYAMVRFGRSHRAEQEFRDVLDGIRTKVSVGYRVHRMIREEGQTDGVETFRATLWEPLEISTVAIPADDSVGVGRALTLTHQHPMPPNQTPPNDGDAKAGEPLHTRSKVHQIANIRAIGERFGFQSAAERFVLDGRTEDEFREYVLEARGKAKPVPFSDPSIGMSPREVSRYSIVRALNSLAQGRQLDGLEFEASAEVARRTGRQPKGFFIPHDIASRSLEDSRQLTRHDIEAIIGRLDMQRALNATTATAGGFLVGTDTLGSSMIELLRKKAVVLSLGARTLNGLVGDIAIPRHTGGATAYWLSETAAAPSSQQTFGQLGLTPHRLVGTTPFSKQLLVQASLDVEALVRNDLMAVLALEQDRAALNGSGASGEPLGILNTTGIGSVTFGAAATWAKVVEFETTLATANADTGGIAYLTTPASRGKWKTITKVSSDAGSGFLWEMGGRIVNGYRAEATNQVPSDKVIFGNWSDFLIASWDGLDIVVDPYTLAKSHQVEITITLMVDMAVRHAASFVASSDSGAQ